MAAGGTASFPGVVGTAVVKVFDLEVARTGLTLAEAQAAGLDAAATDVVHRSRAKYYPGSVPLSVRLVHERSGRVLGAQLVGREGAAKRVDVVAAALHAQLTVADLVRARPVLRAAVRARAGPVADGRHRRPRGPGRRWRSDADG